MRLTVLNVAYPLAPVHAGATGGAEQVLWQIDRALVSAGHHSIVLGCAGSHVSGELEAVPQTDGGFHDDAVMAAQRKHAATLIALLQRRPVDLVHMHGSDFARYLPPPGVPTLVTLHMPLRWYSLNDLRPARPSTYLHCVSRSQQGNADLPHLLPPIENGVTASLFAARHRKCRFALMLARICPEKGVHIAIDAAKRAGVPLVIAGEVFPYPEHQSYFEQEVRPRLDRLRRFIGRVGLQRKCRLLAAARCVLVSSLIPETSSLVAREALAAGTPVVGFGKGALAEIIDHGRTGFLVWDEREMAWAIAASRDIDPEACRAAARERFSPHDMTRQYLQRYRELVAVSQQMGATA